MNEQNIFIVRCGEVALKGMNKPYFERMLVDRIRSNVKGLGNVDVRRQEGLIFVRADKDVNTDILVRQISKVFGVASISPAVEAPSNLDDIGEEAVKYTSSNSQVDEAIWYPSVVDAIYDFLTKQHMVKEGI